LDDTDGPSSEHEFFGLGISWDRTVDENLRYFGWANYSDRNFYYPHVRTAFLFDRDDAHLGAGLGMTRYFNDRASMSLTWSWFDQNSRVNQFDYNSHEVGLSLSVDFP
jgi:hypothetical protein